MYYRLKEPWAFRGWQKTPFAITALAGQFKQEKPFFFKKDEFLELLYCNGEEDINIENFTDTAKQTIHELMNKGFMESSETALEPLKEWQRYNVYPSRYVRSVHWSITGKCNFKCRHCLVSAPLAKHPQLPLEDCIHIVHEIAKCGIKRVDITGGEPLLRRDFEEIVKELEKYGIDIGVIFTNASLLNQDVLDMLKRHKQHPAFQLSFDGKGHHDWLRGIDGAEKQADDAFRLLQENKLPAVAAMCIHKGNRESLRATINYLAGYGVLGLRLNAPQDFGIWREYSDEYALSEDEVWETYREYIPYYFQDGMPLDLELDGYFNCKKGATFYTIPYSHDLKENMDWNKIPYCESTRFNTYIGPEGNLAPCMGFSDSPLKEKFPNVLKQPLAELTLSGFTYDIVNTKVADFLAKNPECRDCEHLGHCTGGCMLADITDEGDFLVPDKR